jgi:hypothetical protein
VVCLNIFQKTLHLGIKKLRFGASSESLKKIANKFNTKKVIKVTKVKQSIFVLSLTFPIFSNDSKSASNPRLFDTHIELLSS